MLFRSGTIKKFGQDVNTGDLERLEYRANQNITHLIVNSEEVVDEYSSAFGVSEEKIILSDCRGQIFFWIRVFWRKREDSFWTSTRRSGENAAFYMPPLFGIVRWTRRRSIWIF